MGLKYKWLRNNENYHISKTVNKFKWGTIRAVLQKDQGQYEFSFFMNGEILKTYNRRVRIDDNWVDATIERFFNSKTLDIEICPPEGESFSAMEARYEALTN